MFPLDNRITMTTTGGVRKKVSVSPGDDHGLDSVLTESRLQLPGTLSSGAVQGRPLTDFRTC